MSASQPTSTSVGQEHQPLLGPQKPTSYSKAASDSDDTAVEVEITAADEEAAIPAEVDQPIELPKRKTTVWLVLWYTLLLVIASLAIGFFVKGFMDADDVDFDLGKALKSALGGGLSGAAAMVLQVLTLMPLRTIMNYQYRYGTTTTHATLTLWREGGFSRYYQGLLAALIQGPVSRFGDTAANAGILALLSSNTFMRSLPTVVKSVFASVAAALFRMILTPIDTVKTTLQTQGKRGWGILRTRIRVYGLSSLFYGAWATAAATFVGHFPWFGTYNFLQENLPPAHTLVQTLLRQAFIGFVASVISDTVSNSLRVVKTYRQVNETRVGYMDAARAVIATDGVRGLLGRGLKTRIIANGCQGLMFSILWKLFMDLWNDHTK
ncbi:mitochondrial carrier [Dentipellis sp. KUC8613]|nr:mitochondrial carrier [Dentipellis sp. KUC8613]